jgi:hypothetical protein
MYTTGRGPSFTDIDMSSQYSMKALLTDIGFQISLAAIRRPFAGMQAPSELRLQEGIIGIA